MVIIVQRIEHIVYVKIKVSKGSRLDLSQTLFFAPFLKNSHAKHAVNEYTKKSHGGGHTANEAKHDSYHCPRICANFFRIRAGLNKK